MVINLKSAKGDEKLTDSGRVVYGGGGIGPDVVVKTPTISRTRERLQRKLVSPIFAFTMDLAYGKMPGFDTYQVDRPITYDYDLKGSDFPITPKVYLAFRKYAASKYGIKASQVDSEKEFVERILRTELVTAAYGSRTSPQVYNEYDPQLKKAMELLPEAKQLALRGQSG